MVDICLTLPFYDAEILRYEKEWVPQASENSEELGGASSLSLIGRSNLSRKTQPQGDSRLLQVSGVSDSQIVDKAVSRYHKAPKIIELWKLDHSRTWLQQWRPELWSSLSLLRVCLLHRIVTLGKVFPSRTGHFLSTGSSPSPLS